MRLWQSLGIPNFECFYSRESSKHSWGTTRGHLNVCLTICDKAFDLRLMVELGPRFPALKWFVKAPIGVTCVLARLLLPCWLQPVRRRMPFQILCGWDLLVHQTLNAFIRENQTSILEARLAAIHMSAWPSATKHSSLDLCRHTTTHFSWSFQGKLENRNL